jgi:glycosyltransferase involved in cell wall biosynthesis
MTEGERGGGGRAGRMFWVYGGLVARRGGKCGCGPATGPGAPARPAFRKGCCARAVVGGARRLRRYDQGAVAARLARADAPPPTLPSSVNSHQADRLGVDERLPGADPARARGPLRILYVTPRYLPEIGGVEAHVHAVAARLAAAGRAQVTVLTTDNNGELPALDHDGEAVIRRVRAHPRGRDWRFAPGLGAVIRAGDWDLVHVQSYHTFVAPMAMAAAARARVPYVLTFHGGGHSDPLRHRLRSLQRALLRPLLARAAALVAIAQFEIDEYAPALRIPPGRFVLIPNGFDLPPAASSAEGTDAHAETPSGPLIVSLGRLERYKGHQYAIAALPHVLALEPGARLWIAGSGPYEAELRRQAAQLGVAERVEISSVPLGERAELARRLAGVDLAVAFSDFESHPIAALEVLALGRPLLVAPGSGLGELAAKGYARAIDPRGRAQDTAAEIVRELHDPHLPPRTHFPTWDDCANALLALYLRILARSA